MTPFLLAAALSCPPIIQENQADNKWSNHDRKILESYKARCGEVFPEAPCVAMIVKREARVYWVICGATSNVRKELN